MKMRYSTVLAIGALCLFSCFTGMPALAVETTLYVGKHFEVRDHDQPTKYVFNGDTRIARITGSLSTNTRIQRFRLHAGWNLLSLAVSATNLSEQLQRSGVINSARAWNPQAGSYSTVPQVTPAGTVLWVNATTNTTLGVVGTYADPVHRQITAGATYLPSTGLEAWTPTLPPSVAAWSFDSQPPGFNSQPTWHARLTGDLSSINDLPNTFPPGQALYIINNAPFELEIPDPALRIRYYHQDHLGSSSIMTDASGVLVEETAFYPFGIPRHEHRLRSIEEHYKFTQKERDRESGLHYFEARYLAGRFARFGSPDPKYVDINAASSDPQVLNLYAYAHSNPLRYVDPTGLEDEETDDEEKSCGASFSAGAGDGLLPEWTLWGPAFLNPLGALGPSIGPSFGFGPAARGWLNINNVDEDSGCYTAGGIFQTAISFAIGPKALGAVEGGSTAVKALGGGGGGARSVVDPLADTVKVAGAGGGGASAVKTWPGGWDWVRRGNFNNSARREAELASSRKIAWAESLAGKPEMQWWQGTVDAYRGRGLLPDAKNFSLIDMMATLLFRPSGK